MFFFDILFYGAVIVIVAAAIIVSLSIKYPNVRKPVISSDGHEIPKHQDITCTNLKNHYHRSNGYDALPRYIVHEEPTQGYVILNGVKRRIKDCKNL